MKNKGWQMIEGITQADVAFEAYGETVEEVFENSAKALMEVMVDIATVKQSQSLKFKMKSPKLEDLLFEFLSELVFLKDAEDMVFSKFDLKIKKLATTNYQLVTNLWGEEINPKKHKVRLDVKAITRHQFFLKREKRRYIVRVVLDV